MANAPNRRATLDDLRRARDEGRAVELIDGEIVEKAAPTFEHGTAQTKLGEARHDAVGFRRDLHVSRPTGMPVTVRPDWVCEVLSASTARKDLVNKQRTMHAHQVPHYWLVDPESEVVTVLRWSEAGYVQALTATVRVRHRDATVGRRRRALSRAGDLRSTSRSWTRCTTSSPTAAKVREKLQ